MSAEMFKLDKDYIYRHDKRWPGYELGICCNPGSRFHGWLFMKYPAGNWVSWKKLDEIDLTTNLI